MRRLSVYVHVPFCVTKCAYCDFNSFAGMDDAVDAYVEAVTSEIARCPFAGASVPTVFFGGGTPTYLSSAQLTRILTAVRERFQLDADCEITSEANPGTVDSATFADLRAAGFNRLSIGIQSFDDEELRLIDRIHTGRDALNAYRAARRAGFENINFDLIYGLPEQTQARWRSNLGTALELRPEHLALYGLMIEPNTPFYRLHRWGKLKLPSDEIELAMFEDATTLAAEAGYVRYEISNYALHGQECRHNIVYWRNEEYVGFGPGAVSFVDGRRWTNVKHPRRYVERVQSFQNLTIESETLSAAAALSETVMLGLRMTAGVDLSELQRRFDLPAREIYASVIADEIANGRLECDAGVFRLTPAGMLFASDVSAAFLNPA